MSNTPSDILGKVGSLPKQITDVTDSISKGAAKVDAIVAKMDAAVKGVPTHNPVSGAVKSGLSNVTGALKSGSQNLNNKVVPVIQSAGTKISSTISPVSAAANSIQASLADLQNCQQVFMTSSFLVDAVVGSVSGHFHPRVNEKLFSSFDQQWDSWAKTVNDTFQALSPSGQTNVLEDFAKNAFGDNIYALGSSVKNEAAGIFGGIADFEEALHVFRGSYRNPVEVAKKIEKGVKDIVKATERVANSINGMIKRYQTEMGDTATGNKVMDYLGNLHDTKFVLAINKTLTLGGGAATLFTDVQGLQGALKSKNPQAIFSAGKKTVDDAKKVIKGLKDSNAAQNTTPLASNATTERGDAALRDNQQNEQNKEDKQQDNNTENRDISSANVDSYVCSGAIMKCSFGDKQAKLTVYPDRTVYLTGQPMANVSDHTSLYNIAPFGKCYTTRYPATAAATAANHGHLTPMPCIPGTMTNWQQGKEDYIIKGDSALLKSSFCRCCYGGIITILHDGQKDTGKANLNRDEKKMY